MDSGDGQQQPKMILHSVVQFIFLLAGIVSLLASLFDWEWFFTADNASFLVKRLGRNGARLAYGTMGLMFIAVAIYFHCSINSL